MWLDLFYDRFPLYFDYKIPMWSKWDYGEDSDTLSITAPGFEKEDFDLFIEDGDLTLKVVSGKNHLLYSILNKFHTDAYRLDEAKAKYKNGILKITIPKEVKKTKKIAIEVS